MKCPVRSQKYGEVGFTVPPDPVREVHKSPTTGLCEPHGLKDMPANAFDFHLGKMQPSRNFEQHIRDVLQVGG